MVQYVIQNYIYLKLAIIEFVNKSDIGFRVRSKCGRSIHKNKTLFKNKIVKHLIYKKWNLLI